MKELAPTKAPRFRPIQSIMKDEHARKRLNSLIDEAVSAKQEIFALQERIRGAKKIAMDELKLNPKLFTAYLGAAYNNDYAVRLDGLNQMVDLLEQIVGALPAPTEGGDEDFNDD